VKTVAAQEVRQSTTASLNNIVVPDSGKVVVMKPERRITKLDAASLQKYTSVTEGKIAKPRCRSNTRNTPGSCDWRKPLHIEYYLQ
jgi:hypothetical protein